MQACFPIASLNALSWSRGSLARLLFCSLLAILSSSTITRADCNATADIGADTSLANRDPGYVAVVWIGHSWNQVFTTDDTLVQSIAVWRPARNDSMYFPIKLYVLEVDSSYEIQR